MKKLLFLLLLVASFGCECVDDQAFTKLCEVPSPCYFNDEGEMVVMDEFDEFRYWNRGSLSNCSLGSTTCDPETGELICENYRPPELFAEDEICDGRDNNCNFSIDEGLTIDYDEPGNECPNNNGFCIQRSHCEYGLRVCKYIAPDWCGPEKCDGFDNDGDGLVDNDDPDLEVEFVWPEDAPPLEEISFAEESRCQIGVKLCIEGFTVTEGLRTPIPEQCGNNIDDDCDGIVDETENPNYTAAFGLVIDGSGSMTSGLFPYLGNITSAICSWASDDTFSDSLFSVTFIGAFPTREPDVSEFPTQIVFLTDFTDADTLCALLNSEPWDGIQGGAEFQLLGMKATHQMHPMLDLDRDGQISNAELSVATDDALNWPEGMDKKVIMFSDEEPHPFGGLTWEEEIDSTIESCQTNDYTVGVFTPYIYRSAYTRLRDECGGFIESLPTNEQQAEELLYQHFTGGC